MCGQLLGSASSAEETGYGAVPGTGAPAPRPPRPIERRPCGMGPPPTPPGMPPGMPPPAGCCWPGSLAIPWYDASAALSACSCCEEPSPPSPPPSPPSPPP
eukprot:scaffold16618_cov48-Phaeocystis_antarctica.AAC.1